MYRLTFVYRHDDEDDDDKVLAKRFSKFLHIHPSKHPQYQVLAAGTTTFEKDF